MFNMLLIKRIIQNYKIYVLAKGYDGSGYAVNDPGYSKTRYTTGEITRASIFRA